MRSIFVTFIAAMATHVAAAAAPGHQARTAPTSVPAKAVDLVQRIQRADYEGDRPALRRFSQELVPVDDNRTIGSRVRYWRGFALWRRALNGFNESADADDLAADLNAAVSEFERALAADPLFVDAKIGLLSCLQNLSFVRRSDTVATKELVGRFVPILRELLVSAPDNPRFLWVLGATNWYPLPGLSDQQIKERRATAFKTYERGLTLAKQRTPSPDLLEPSWGEPELLMNLAWSHFNATDPNVQLAESYARQALAVVPHWHYVRDILLPQILKRQPARYHHADTQGQEGAAAPYRRPLSRAKRCECGESPCPAVASGGKPWAAE